MNSSLRAIGPEVVPLQEALERPRSFARRRWICHVLSVTWLLVVGGCRPVPQVANDEAVHKELDALYTAVTSRRRPLVDECHERLKTLQKEGRISEAGFATVASIIKEAENDNWQNAAQQLHDFMRAQRKTKGD